MFNALSEFKQLQTEFFNSLAFAQKQLNDHSLLGELYVEAGSQTENYRQHLRTNLQKKFSVSEPEITLQSWSNLKQIPQKAKGFLSLSHTLNCGGFVSSDLNKIGFDIELTERVSFAVIQRTCEPEELAEAPHYSLLWSSKEAAFKACSAHSNIHVLSEIKLMQWHKVGLLQNPVYSFSVKPSTNLTLKHNKGFTFLTSSHIWTIFFF